MRTRHYHRTAWAREEKIFKRVLVFYVVKFRSRRVLRTPSSKHRARKKIKDNLFSPTAAVELSLHASHVPDGRLNLVVSNVTLSVNSFQFEEQSSRHFPIHWWFVVVFILLFHDCTFLG